MLRKIDSLVPAFLKDLDKHLLLNHPTLWATRVHYLLFVVLGIFGLMGFRALVPGIDVASPPSPSLWFWLALIPTVAIFLFWGFSASLFEVERFFGHTSRIKQVGVQVIYLGGMMVLGVVPFVLANTITYHMAHSVTDATLASDVNVLNMGDVYFPKNRHDLRTLPDQSFSRFTYWNEYEMGVMREEELIEEFQTQTVAEQEELIVAYIDVLEKYSGYRPEGVPSEIRTDYRELNMPFTHDESFREAIESVHLSLNRITTAKGNGYEFQDLDTLLGTAFTLFLAWLLFMIFIRTKGNQFLVAILMGISGLMISFILGFIMIEFFRWEEEIVIATLFFSWFAVLWGMAFVSGASSTQTRFWKTISLMLATAMTPFVPLFVGAAFGYFEEETSLFLGTVFSFLVWSFVFNQRFFELQAAPGKD